MKIENYNYIKETSRIIQLFFNWINNEVANYIACQSALETAYGRSVIFKENFNCFGMKMPTTRITTAYNEKRGHAAYLTFSDSIIDYFLWCSWYGMKQKHFSTIETFKENMPYSKYCPNTTYKTNIELIYKSFTKRENAYGEQQENGDPEGSEESQ